MKDKVFIIWSGDISVALKVKATLENKYNYICYVGGNSQNDSQMLSVGDTVVRQMKSCNQAIVIFKNKADGAVSNNLFFELGFVSASYGMKKVHCVKRKSDNITLPSDFDNSFIEALEADNDDDYAESIVNYFMGRQKLSVDTNKMYLINNRYMIHEMIQAHYSETGSKCSDYELAQYILFYMQASVMYQDEPKILEELTQFKRYHNNEFSAELHNAVNMSIAFLEVQSNLRNDQEAVYIEDSVFREYYNTCKDMLKEIQNDDSGTFDEWAKMILAENLAYVCAVYAKNPHLSKDFSNMLFGKTLEYGKQFEKHVTALENSAPCIENNDHVGLISMFKGYIYRHMFNACLALQNDEALHWITESMRERQSLLRIFDKNSVDTKIYANFQMEYYLNLIEYLDFVHKEGINQFDYMMYLNDIDSFLQQCNSANDMHSYIQKIAYYRNHVIN